MASSSHFLIFLAISLSCSPVNKGIFEISLKYNFMKSLNCLSFVLYIVSYSSIFQSLLSFTKNCDSFSNISSIVIVFILSLSAKS